MRTGTLISIHASTMGSDVSGATLKRPAFEKMMERIYNGDFNSLVCYKLDRVSRSTSDFSNLIKELELINVPFISIKENFDLTTPMGKAMTMITSVFAELERETIAERVRDNMHDRAKLGRWNGGPVPIGFDVKRESIETVRGPKQISKLIINEEEAEVVRKIYKWYLKDEGSIRKVAQKCNLAGYRTKNNKLWRSNQISRVLSNSIYAIADKDSFNYFKNYTKVNMFNTIDEYNGVNALMFYNRRRQHKNTTRENDETEWILSVAEHEGIISGADFAKTQLKIKKRNQDAPRTGQSTKSPLSGLVKCGKCNSIMAVTASPRDSSNLAKGYYIYLRCSKKLLGPSLCNSKNIRADKVENLVVKYIKNLSAKEDIITLLDSANDKIENRQVPLIAAKNKLYSELSKLDHEKSNLVDALSEDILPKQLIKKKYQEIEEREKAIREELDTTTTDLDSSYEDSFNLNEIQKNIKQFNDTYDCLGIEEKKKMLASMVKGIVVNKNNIKLMLNFLPEDVDVWL